MCENKNINETIIDINNKTQIIETDKTIINKLNIQSMFTFESKSEFILIQKENYGYSVERPEIENYIPKIENEKITILIKNTEFNRNKVYSIILVEDNSDEDYLLNKLDSECYLFSLINNETNDINHEIKKYSLNGERFLFEEIDCSKFYNSNNLLIRIYSCENEKDACVFSKANKIYFLKKKENLE